MALDRNRLRDDILTFLDAAASITGEKAQKEHLANSLSTAVDAYVRAATVTDISFDVIGVEGVTVSQTKDGRLQ